MAGAIAIYEVSGEGIAAALLGGGFFARAEPTYAVLIEFVTAITLDEPTGRLAHAEQCIMAQF